MPINDVLGRINALVEHNQFKVVIIANEKEIGTVRLTDNLELKYLAAIQNIDFPKKKQREGLLAFSSNTQDEGTNVNVKELKERVQHLFDEDTLYKIAKEKVIGRTIVYKPDARITTKEVIGRISRNKYIRDHVDSIADDVFYVCSREDYSNMRTVVHSVAFCDRILKLFDDSLYDSKLEYLIKVLIGSIVRTAINYKKAKTPMEWQEGKEYDSGTYGDPFKLHEYSMIFRFVEDYFYGSSFSEDRVKRVLDDFMREHEKNNPFDTLSSYWEMEDQAIKDAITRTREWLYEKKI